MLLTALIGCRMVDSDDGIDDGSKTDEPGDNTVVYTKELWGEWLRMDTGDTWYISDNTVTINGTEAATSATLTKQSDQVLEVTDGGRKYYLYASRTATASFTGVIAMDAAGSARAASRGRKVTAKNQNNEANESSAVTDEDGKFTVEGVILGDPYQVIPEGGTPVTITPKSDGGDVGVITVTTGVNFKTSLIPTQSSTDMTELYMNEAYQFEIEFENVGDEDCPAPSYTIIEPSGVIITGALQGILGTIEPGVKKSVPISVRCSTITSDHEYKKISIRIADGAGKTWDDSVSLRFYKETMGFNIKAEKPISGIIISPDTKTYSFTDVTDGVVVTPRRTAGNYLVVFSGATIETETRYSLGIGTEADGDFSTFTETWRYEPNNAEDAAVSLSEQKLMAYLYKNDIDYYRVFYGNFRLPPAPTNVSASAADAQVTVSWTTVTGASSYNVYRSDSQTGTYTKVGAPTTASYVDTVTTVGTYYYKVSTMSASDFESALSTPITVAVAGPAAPTNVTASAADNKVTVSWTTVTSAKSYTIYRSDSQTGTYTKVGASTTTSYVDTVTAIGTYYYKASVVSMGDFESAPSTPTAVAVTPPAAPTNVSASVADAQVTVSWTAVTGASSYNIYRAVGSTETYTKVGASTTASYVDTVAATGTYYYKASAVSASDFESAHSTPIAVAVTPPAVPTDVSASAADAQVTVSWTTVDGAESYNVYRSTSQTGTYTKVGASTMASYVDTVTATGTYYYKVSAVSEGGLESNHSTSTTVAVTTIGIDVTSLSETLSWLSANAVNSTHYTLSLTRDETISAQLLSYSGKTDITISLKGKGGNRTVSLAGNGALFTVNSGATLVLDSDVTLKGHSSNTASLVYVNPDGNLVLKDGAKISGNTVVAVAAAGGGVFVRSGTFTMSGGEISGNTASEGGGVNLNSTATFTMSGGTISGNTVSGSYGGGVLVNGGTFTMSDGAISGNTAPYSGGVSVMDGTFIKQAGGIIYGSNATSALQNTATAGDGYGHAVFVNSSPTKKRYTTVGVGATLDSRTSGGWE
jgi:fibronectin type 3 domain-containing protein